MKRAFGVTLAILFAGSLLALAFLSQTTATADATAVADSIEFAAPADSPVSVMIASNLVAGPPIAGPTFTGGRKKYNTTNLGEFPNSPVVP